MKIFQYLLTSFCFAFLSTAVYAQNHTIEKLELLDVEGTDKKKGYMEVVFNGEPQEIFDVITDFENFDTFMPRNKNIEMQKRTPALAIFTVDFKMPFPVSDISFDNRIKIFADEYRTEFKMVPGSSEDVEDFYGYWRLEPKGENKTRGEYEVFFLPKKRFPRFIERKASKKSLEDLASVIQEQVDKRKK